MKEINTNNSLQWHILREYFCQFEMFSSYIKKWQLFLFKWKFQCDVGRDWRSLTGGHLLQQGQRGDLSAARVPPSPTDLPVSFLCVAFLFVCFGSPPPQMFPNSIFLQEGYVFISPDSPSGFKGLAFLRIDLTNTESEDAIQYFILVLCDQVPYSTQQWACIFCSIPFAASRPAEALLIALHIPCWLLSTFHLVPI